MSAGDRRHLYVLACDHRASFRRSLFGEDALTPSTAARAASAKRVVFDALLWAIEHGVDRAQTALLMDTETGADVIAAAQRYNIRVAIPVERGGGQPVFEFDHGPEFRAHIQRYQPDYAKALVRYNPKGEAAVNALQRERLGRLSRWLYEAGRRFLLELIVPATAAQLRSVGEYGRRYDAELRPGLMVAAISELQAANVRPRVWKVEGLDMVDDSRAVADQCRSVAEDVSCVVLGRGADLDQVHHWLTTAGRAGGYDGFAVGRSIWLRPLVAYVCGQTDRAATVARIGVTYLHLAHTFVQAADGVR
jgi:myo-inositol catabolism protein IolC